MPVDVLLGLQWGDEGKGKIVDVLTPNYKVIARFQGGPNAGHTVVVGEETFKLHLIPSGIVRPDVRCLVGGVIDRRVRANQRGQHFMNFGRDDTGEGTPLPSASRRAS